MAKNAKQAYEAVTSSIVKALEVLSKKEYTAQEANERVKAALIGRITALEETLVKMRQLEGESLSKGLHGLPSAPTPTNEQMMAQVQAKPKLTVFDILKNKGQVAKRELEIESPSEKNTDPKRPGAILPSDKPAKKQDEKDTGSGGKIMKKSESPIFKNVVFSQSSSFAPKPMSSEDQTKRLAILRSVSGTKPVESGNPTVSMRAPMAKAGGLPRLGGKDQASKDMTTHAISDAAKKTKDAQMPAAQKMLPKMPSMKDHQARSDMYADFMPQPGKFNKDELMKDIEDIDQKFNKLAPAGK
jgi:hypothetical protein